MSEEFVNWIRMSQSTELNDKYTPETWKFEEVTWAYQKPCSYSVLSTMSCGDRIWNFYRDTSRHRGMCMFDGCIWEFKINESFDGLLSSHPSRAVITTLQGKAKHRYPPKPFQRLRLFEQYSEETKHKLTVRRTLRMRRWCMLPCTY